MTMFPQMGETDASAYIFGQHIKMAKVALSINQDASKQRQSLQSAYDASLKRIEELELALRDEQNKSAGLEKKMEEWVTQYEAKLKVERERSSKSKWIDLK